MDKQLMIFAVRFRRTKPKKTEWSAMPSKSEGWESGVFVGKHGGDEDGFIVDMDGKTVKVVYDYRDHFYEGTMIVRGY
jgi:hypothetical protein